MPTILVPDGIRVTMKFRDASQQVRNVFYVKANVAIDEALLSTVAEVFKDSWNSNLQGYTSQLLFLDAVEAVDASVVGGTGIEFTTGLPIQGNSTLGGVPNNVTVATKLSTGRVGRSYRGRSYMNGIPQVHITSDQQHIDATLVTQLGLFFETIMTDLALSSCALCVASLYSGVDADHKPIPRAAGILTEVISTSTNTTLDSQRRRLPERGS